MKKNKLFWAFGIALLLAGIVYFLVSVRAQTDIKEPEVVPQNPPYQDATLPLEERVQNLLSYMTLEEKVGQMALVEKNSIQSREDIQNYGIGALLSGAGAKPEVNTVEGWKEMVDDFMSASKESRLQIPLLYGADAFHGNANVPGSTVFPHSIGLGATNDADLIENVARATARELAATHVVWNFAPNLDLPQDIRWGRTYETFSDDPIRAGKLGAAYVRGLHEESKLSSSSSIFVLSTPKHYLGAGGMIWESSSNRNFHLDQGTTPGSETTLRDTYLPPFKEAVDEGAQSVMVALAAWGEEGVPPEGFIVEPLLQEDFGLDATFVAKTNALWRNTVLAVRGYRETKLSAHTYLITDVLKGELGFKGFTVSDWYGVYEIPGGDYKAAVTAINAGIDMVMLPFDYKTFVENVTKAVKKGEISEARIDDAVARILRAKFALGLFDGKEYPEVDVVGSDEHRELAREAVASSQVLLKNEASVLPLDSSIEHIRVVGSAADNVGMQSGAWTVEWQGIDGNWLPGATSILAGIKARVGEGVRVEYDKGGNFKNETEIADIGIAVVGETPYAEGWGDRAVPTLSTEDLDAIAELKKVSEKVVVVVISGRPLFVTNEIENWDSVIAAWLPGSEGGGIADVLFGDKPFEGTLPLPWPAYTQQLPILPNGETADGTSVLFPRGFGLMVKTENAHGM